jgi:ERO1-like protein beta
VDEKDIPLIWRAKELSKLEGPKAAHPGKKLQQERGAQKPLQGTLGENVGESCVVEYDDECDERDYCLPEDESANAKGDYVSLVDNPERFTGYAGRDVWDAIYRENCFSKGAPVTTVTDSGSFELFQARHDLRSVIQAGVPSSELALDDECLEKRVFHRLVSGMHASISTHICKDYLNQTTGAWGPNLQCYQDRLAAHPERISNLYFNYALLLRAVTKLRTYLRNYTFCLGDPDQDFATKSKVLRLADRAASGPPIFDESTMFHDPIIGAELKEDFRQRFRNVSRLMDCVGCDKCRLWGKLQTVGYGTALKVLFEYDELKNGENPPLRRTELVALVNTLDRVSSSLTALGNLRKLSRGETSDESKRNGPDDEHEGQIKLESEGFFHPLFEDEEGSMKISPPEDSILESVLDEWYLVWRALAFVIRSWIGIPGKAFKILIFEMGRIWAYFLGLPIQPRSWEIRLPSRDEI